MVRRAFALCCAWLAACAGGVPDGPQPALMPGAVIRGARLEASGPYTLFVNPVAVGASASEVYVADAGLAMLVRVDAFGGVMSPVVRRRFAPNTRIAVDADATLYVLDPAERRIRRYARDGRVLGDYTVDATVGAVSELVLDTARGRLFIADALHRQLVAFHPLGRAYEVLPLHAAQRDALFSVGALAGARDALYASDPRCACLARLARDGRVLATFGHGHLRQPGRLVADRYGRIVVADGAERSLKVFQGERLAAEFAFAGLGLAGVTDMALAEDWIYIADAAGRQVRALRVMPP